MLRSSLSLCTALVVALSMQGIGAGEEASPFAPFGSREGVRRKIAGAYLKEMGEEMAVEDLDRAVEAALRSFEQSLNQEARRVAEDVKARRAVGEFHGGRFVLQVRSGAGGGNPNRISMIRKTSNYVDEVRREPLNLGGQIGIDESSQGFSSGGYIPKGRILVITKIVYRGSAAGDSNGHGEMIVKAGRTEIFSARDNSEAQSDTWRGRLVVRPGEEDGVFVEVANSSECEAVVHGFVAREEWADPEHKETLTEESKAVFRKLLDRLDDDDATKRDEAQTALTGAGPPVAEFLRGLDTSKLSAEARSRVAEVLETFPER